MLSKKIKVLLLCGVSGSGKTYIESSLIKNSNKKWRIIKNV